MIKLSKVIFLDPLALELKNMITVDLLITESALARKNSVGAHYRTDYKRKIPWMGKHLKIRKRDRYIEIF